jgi:hypothetical protein
MAGAAPAAHERAGARASRDRGWRRGGAGRLGGAPDALRFLGANGATGRDGPGAVWPNHAGCGGSRHVGCAARRPCHAEGRGFESHHPLLVEALLTRGFRVSRRHGFHYSGGSESGSSQDSPMDYEERRCYTSTASSGHGPSCTPRPAKGPTNRPSTQARDCASRAGSNAIAIKSQGLQLRGASSPRTGPRTASSGRNSTLAQTRPSRPSSGRSPTTRSST